MNNSINPISAGVAAFAVQAVTFEALIQKGILSLAEAQALTRSAIGRFDQTIRTEVETAIRQAFPALFLDGAGLN